MGRFTQWVKRYTQRFLQVGPVTHSPQGEPQMIAAGWESYAKNWQPKQFDVLEGHQVQHLGDEWTAEDISANGSTTYGLESAIVLNFDQYLQHHLLDPYLPPHAVEGLEIGPGGGRLTDLLLPRTQILHVIDASATMLAHLQKRFAHDQSLRYYHTDGYTLPSLSPGSLDYAIALDVFVHFEPRLIFWYLRQIASLLKPGGVGIVHYANLLTPIGWTQFSLDLEANFQSRQGFAAFGVMCPPIMAQFLTQLNLEIVSLDLGLFPRDAVTVFRRSPAMLHPVG
ncbi:MAG: class I SAM-dependent methyltransferase [Leptolyngbyaceae cyanobacterium bins.59]|nr:class I SAM-dependent methyltransferase [Leptolyngbyaceae cyanobacterium bins.59]